MYKTIQFIEKIETNIENLEKNKNRLFNKYDLELYNDMFNINKEVLLQLKTFDFVNKEYLENVMKIIENTIEFITYLKKN